MNWLRIALAVLCSFYCKRCGEQVTLKLLSASTYVVLQTECSECGSTRQKQFRRLRRPYRRLFRVLSILVGFSLATFGIWAFAVLVLTAGGK